MDPVDLKAVQEAAGRLQVRTGMGVDVRDLLVLSVWVWVLVFGCAICWIWWVWWICFLAWRPGM